MRDWIVRSLVLLISGLALVVPAAADETPTAVVDHLNKTLLSVMQNADALGYDGRYARLAPVLSDVFAFRTMARVASGSHWRGLTSDQRDRLSDTFARFSISTYADRFDGFSGERFEILSEEPAARGSMIVRTRIVTGSGEIIPLDYLLRENSGTWRVYDVYLRGTISELATRRSEYTAILDDAGFDGLITLVEGRIANMDGGSG